MSKNIIRSIKYLISISLLFVAILLLMLLTGTSKGNLEQSIEMVLGSRGLFTLGALLLLALLYPRFGFTRREVQAQFLPNKAAVFEAFHRSGYSFVEQNEKSLRFRASAPIKRFFLLWEDPIVLTIDEHSFAIEGIRKEVVKIQFRIETLLCNSPQSEQE